MFAVAFAADDGTDGKDRGWRFDGSGVFPVQSAPVTWSDDKHIAWKISLPHWGFNSPVVVGEQVLILTEPTVDCPTLHCYDLASGSERWSVSVDHFAHVPDGKQWRAAWRSEVAWEQRAHEWFYRYHMEQDESQRALIASKAEKDDVALRPEHNKNEPRKSIAAVDPAAQKERRSRIADASGSEMDAWFRWGLHLGKTFATPVSDGEHVYVSTAFNFLACYRLADGQQVWGRWFGPAKDFKRKLGYYANWPWCFFNHSPRVADGTLVVQSGCMIRGIDAASGTTRWEHAIEPAGAYGSGSPVLIEVQGRHLAVFTQQNRAYDLHTGDVLIDKLVDAGRPSHSCAAFADDVIYMVAGDKKAGDLHAIRLTFEGEQCVPKTLWTFSGPKFGHCAPVVHAGTVYTASGDSLVLLDAETGDEKARNKNAKVNGSMALCLAGKHVYAKLKDQVKVFDRRSGKLVAVNVLKVADNVGEKKQQRIRTVAGLWAESFGDTWHGRRDEWGFGRSTLCFAGNSLLIRSHDELFCIR